MIEPSLSKKNRVVAREKEEVGIKCCVFFLHISSPASPCGEEHLRLSPVSMAFNPSEVKKIITLQFHLFSKSDENSECDSDQW